MAPDWPWRATAVLWALLLAGSVSADSTAYESEPVLDATQLVQPSLLSGPGYRVQPRVEVRGYMASFTIESRLGRLGADSVEILADRIAELPALEALDEVTRSEAFLKASGNRFTALATAFGNVLLHPVQTVAGLPSGVARYLRNRALRLGEQAQSLSDQAAKRFGADGDPYAAGEGPMTDQRDAGRRDNDRGWHESAGAEVGREVKRQLSYNRMKRDIAQRLGIDPYTANPYVHVRLDALAWVASSGNYTAAAAISAVGGGAGVAISETRRIDELVWTLDPDDIRRRVADRLKDRVSDEYVVRRFVRRGVYTPTLQLALVDAIDALKPASGVNHLLELAIGAQSELEARFVVNALRMLLVDPQHREGGRFIAIGAGIAWQLDDGSLVLPLPVDQLSWTREFAEYVDRPEFRTTGKTLLTAAGTSLVARRELTRRGWSLHTHLRWRGSPAYAADAESAPMDLAH